MYRHCHDRHNAGRLLQVTALKDYRSIGLIVVMIFEIDANAADRLKDFQI